MSFFMKLAVLHESLNLPISQDELKQFLNRSNIRLQSLDQDDVDQIRVWIQDSMNSKITNLSDPDPAIAPSIPGSQKVEPQHISYKAGLQAFSDNLQTRQQQHNQASSDIYDLVDRKLSQAEIHAAGKISHRINQYGDNVLIQTAQMIQDSNFDPAKFRSEFESKIDEIFSIV